MNTDQIPTNQLSIFTKEYGRHVAVHYNNALVLATFSGFRDRRLTDEQVRACIHAGLPPQWAEDMLVQMGLNPAWVSRFIA